MKYYLSVFISLLALCSYAQEKISLVIADCETAKPIKNAYVLSDDQNVISNSEGRIFLALKSVGEIRISHISYRDTTIFINSAYLPDTISLKRATKKLEEVQIHAKPYVVFKSEECHVFDYEFLGDTLIILTYEREKMFRQANKQSSPIYLNCKLLLVSPTGNILKERELTDEIIGFHRDPFGKLYLLAKNSVFLLELDLKLKLKPVDQNTFNDQIIPFKTAIGDHLVVDNYSWHYPEFSYFSYNSEKDTLLHIRTVRDEFTLELLRSEYKYMNNRDKLWAYRQELKTGVDKEVISAYKTGFQSSLYYQSLYAPIFRSDSTLLIFDHHAGFIFSHSLSLQTKDSVRLSYLSQTRMKFEKTILKDRESKDFFSVFKKGVSKHLGRINLSSGKVEDLTKLYYPFPENIKLKNGSAYYLYRKPEGEKYTYLYAEHLK